MLPADRDYFALPGIASDVDYKTDIEPMIREMVTLLAVAHLIRKVGMPERTPLDQSASDTI
jgi:hypothetical protein